MHNVCRYSTGEAMKKIDLCIVGASLLLGTIISRAEVKIIIERNGNDQARLGDEWKKGKRLAALGPANSLADDEKKGGWKLLFNGENFDGWHNFKSDSIRAGWQVKDGL